MILLEYEAKDLLRAHGIKVPVSEKITTQKDIPSFFPTILKSQVPTGGRGKLGGVKVINDIDSYKATVSELFQHSIKGYTPNKLLAEELLSIKHEFYLSILVDRPTASLRLLASKDGGIEVESNSTSDFLSLDLEELDYTSLTSRLVEFLNIPNQTSTFKDLIEKLVTCVIENDVTLLEINPLVITSSDEIIAADCKMTLDNSAAFRHTDWDFENQHVDSNFVTLNKNGVVATIANGAGLAMATVDEVANNNLSVANFLDIGGGASEASVLVSFERIMQFPSIKAIVINIFAGITRCDEVARAIIGAKQKINNLPPIYIRLAGTNSEQANKLLDTANVAYFNSLTACVDQLKKDLNEA